MRGGYDNIELARTHAGPPPPLCGGSRQFSMWLKVNCFDLVLTTNGLHKWLPGFASQMLGFKRFYGIKIKLFRLVVVTALQSALQVYSKILVGSGNALHLHLICIYIVFALQVFLHFMWLYISCIYCTWSLGSSIDYLRMIIPIMKWSVESIIIGQAFTSILLRESREKTI